MVSQALAFRVRALIAAMQSESPRINLSLMIGAGDFELSLYV